MTPNRESTNILPYSNRQVYAAFAVVPVETCLECPYFKPVMGGGKNIYGQPGSCCYKRAEAARLSMSGDALCDPVIH